MPACLPVCPHATTRLPLDWFSWKLKFENFTKTHIENWNLIKIWQRITGILNEGLCILMIIKLKVKRSRYRPSVAQRLGRGIALLFHDRGTRRGWVVSSTPRPLFTPGKNPVPILQEVGWAPGPVWTGGESRPHRDSIPDLPARSQSLYRLSYPAHTFMIISRWIIRRRRNVSDKNCKEN